jgi:Uma2 family endonuclease
MPTVQEYIMIDSQKRKIIVVRKRPDNKWGSKETITGNNNLLIETIGYQLTLPEIYKDTGL